MGPRTLSSPRCGPNTLTEALNWERTGVNRGLRSMMLSIHDGCQIPFIPENPGFLRPSANVSRETGTSNGPPLKPQLCCQFLGDRQFLGSRMGRCSLAWSQCLPTELDFQFGGGVAAAHAGTRMDLVPARLDRFIPTVWLPPISDPTRHFGRTPADHQKTPADHQKGHRAGIKYIDGDFRSNSLWPWLCTNGLASTPTVHQHQHSIKHWGTA
jgi:hypothetical protein